jgi:hypothetical protein
MTELDLRGSFGKKQFAVAAGLMMERDLVNCESKLRLVTPNDALRRTLAYSLWKTLRNRRAGRSDSGEVRNILQNVHEAAQTLSDSIAPMLGHPGANTSAANEAAFLMYLSSKNLIGPIQLVKLRNELNALVSTATKAQTLFQQRKGRQADSERLALLEEMRAIAYRYNGGIMRKYTKDPISETFGGDVFLLFKTMENAISRFYGRAPPSDEALAKFIQRSQRTK